MTQLQSALEALGEWEDPITAATTPDPHGTRQSPRRARDPEGGRVERITLRLRAQEPEIDTEVHLYGETAWTRSRSMIEAWALEVSGAADFAVRFRDSQTITGRLDLRRRAERDLAAICRRVSTFRASFCPNLTETEALPLFRFFLGNYTIPV